MKNFYRFNKQKFLLFIGVAVIFNLLQFFISTNAHIFTKYNINNGNAPSYVALSLDVLEKLIGSRNVYPPNQEWFRFANGWAYLAVFLFWIFFWYTAACLIHKLTGSAKKAKP